MVGGAETSGVRRASEGAFSLVLTTFRVAELVVGYSRVVKLVDVWWTPAVIVADRSPRAQEEFGVRAKLPSSVARAGRVRTVGSPGYR